MNLARALVACALLAAAVAQAAPTFQGASAAESGTGGVSVDWPAHETGDVAVLFVESRGNQGITTPAGFTLIGQNNTGGGGGTRLTVYWARATSNAMGPAAIADPGDHVYAQMLTYRGVIAAGDPWGTDTSTSGTSGSSTSVSITGITTSVPDVLVVMASSRNNDSAAASFSGHASPTLAGLTERSDGGTTSGDGGGFAVWDGVKATAGATGNMTANISASVSKAFRTIALWPDTTTYYSRANNDWNTAATWSTVGCGGGAASSVPLAGAHVVICAGDAVVVDVNTPAVSSVTIQAAGTLTMGDSNTARTLTVTGPLSNAGILQFGNNNGDHNIVVGGAFANSGTFRHINNTSGGARSLNVQGLVTNTGTFTYAGRANGGEIITVNAFGGFLNSGTLEVNAGSNNTHALNVGGDFTNNGTADLAPDANSVVNTTLNGAAAQVIAGSSGTTTFNDLTIDNAAGVSLNSHNVTAAGVLALTNGVVTTGSSTLRASAACPAGVTRASGWVAGNLQLRTPAAGSPTCVFHVGDAANYRPLTIDFAALSSAGDVAAWMSQAAIDSTNIASSTFDPAATANRHWILTNAGAVFGSASVTFMYGGDVDAAADESAFVVGRFSAGWTYLATVTGLGTAQATGLTPATLSGEFQIGEQALVAFANWRMDQFSWNGTANEALDSGTGTGGPFHGTASGLAPTKPKTSAASSAIPGSPGTCQYGVFNRANKDYVAVPGAFPNLTASMGAFTVAAWIRSTDSAQLGQRIVVDDESNTTPGGWAFSLGDGGAGTLRFFHRDAATFILDTPGVVGSNTWHYVALVVSLAPGANASRATIYVYDTAGAQLAASTNTFTWNAGGDAGPLAIGGETNSSTENNAGFGFAGNIDEVRIYRSSLSPTQINRIRQETRPCVFTPPVDHYELTLASSSIACMPSTVTVSACADASSPCTNKVLTVAGQTASLAATAGALGSASVIFDASGDATTTLSHPAVADGTLVTVTLSGESTAAANPRRCCPDGANCVIADSCSTTFNTAGFIFSSALNGGMATIPPQIAGTASSQLYLRAVRTNTATKACESPLSSGSPFPVNFAYACNNPSACSAGSWMTVTPVPGAGTALPGSVAMTFDVDGNAPFSFNYRDVGAITLSASATVNGAALAGSTNSFVVKPAKIEVSAIQRASDDQPNPAAADATGSAFMKAGENIELTVSVRNALDELTPNFGKETAPQSVELTPNLVLPSPGNNPALGNGTIAGGVFASGAGGVATVDNITWGEVGIITITPSSNYLGQPVAGTTTGNIGRFTPYDFDVAWNTPEFSPGCGAFTYLGQAFSYAIAPELTVTARNMAGATTVNYEDAFFKITDASLTGKAYSAAAGTVDFAGINPPDPDIVNNNGVATLTFDALTSSAAPAIRFQRPAAPLSVFDAEIALSINVADTDGVAYASNPARVGQASAGNGIAFTGGNKQMRFGRLRMQNGLASSGALSLPIPIEVQYWDGAASVFRRNTADTCTSFVPADFTVTPALGAASVSAVTLSGGAGRVLVTGPGAGVSGSVIVAPRIAPPPALADYLKGSWSGGNWDEDPSARASWGVFGSQPRNFIYQRENF